ncbi:MAG TPA: hypothetical protein DCQ26_03505 [Marinilabiliales bacterium]|nr:MAG: hypothetical protein A2W84_06015 [Bacteroidetes bacterium GWC2_40_13]OFX71335.1 MAG: hypothetical protein A2W96_14315 [Bacteroidetes bacterium GWD2_40_43]OFX91470.1 MAG: hypothetical protein A2W97_04540 [Bacteroidetes bacterium GWE2_40_63]OFY19540.1 MAG: hypothetical protein A2W88_02420 [Bacteroidetes bacterium GWF2_40_13]HAM97654.1 hypothetical protein [Marinilabiliales bacterium]
MKYSLLYTCLFLIAILMLSGISKDTLGAEHPEFPLFLLEKAQKYYLKHNDSASIYIDSCLKLAENKRLSEYASECHLLKAKWYKDHNRFTEALLHVEFCFPYFEASNNLYKIAECKFISGYCKSEMGDYESSISELLKAIPIFDSLNLFSEYQNAQNALAVNFYLLKKYNLAENLWNEVYKYSLKSNDTLLLSKTLNNLAIIYANDSATRNKATEYYTKSIQLALLLGDDAGASNSMMNLANVYLNQNQNAKAKKMLWEANRLNEKNLNQTQQVYILLNLAQLYFQTHHTDSAIFYINKCQLQSELINFKTLMPELFELKASILIQDHRLEEAFSSMLLSSRWKDSLWQENLASVSAEFELKFKAQQQIDEIHIQQAIIEKQQTQLKAQQLKYIGLIVILFFFVLLVMVYGFYSRKLKKSNAELTLMNEVVHEKNLKLEETIAMRDRLLSIIAHDIKNPLATISGFAELIALSPSNQSFERIKSFSGQILSSANNLFDLLDNLLHWAKSQQNGILINPESINVYKLINKNIKLMEPMAQVKSILITNHCSSNTEITADKASINTVVRNLINNAVKFTPNYGKIDISVEKQEDKLMIHFDDNGQGIHPDELQLLFNPEIDRALIGKDTHNKGIGLGLILCYDFMKLNGGTISVSSELNQGSRFTLGFPIH